MRTIGKRSSVQEVIGVLTEALLGDWAPGDRIPTESALSAQLGVSRPVVREAVGALVHIGVLDSRQGAGTFVVSTTDPAPLLRQLRLAGVRDVFEVQLAHDAQAARLAAQRRTAEDLQELDDLLRTRDRADSPDGFGAADADFHFAIVRAARNPVLLEMYRFLLGRLRESLATLRATDSLPEGSAESHGALLDAIRAEDPDAAESAARAVIAPSLAALRDLVS